MEQKYSVPGAIIIAGIIIAGAVIYTFGNNSERTVQVADNKKSDKQEEKQAGAKFETPQIDDDYAFGNPNAPVTIIEFSDFECPFCAKFYSGSLAQLRKEYIDTGKAKLVYRDFPLVKIHTKAAKAAEAAECAEEQGKFAQMHDIIFKNQRAITVDDLKGYARQIGADGDKFDSCLDSGKYFDEVQKDFKDGIAAGVTGTPTFFVNGQKLVGAQPFETFQDIIESELNK